MKSILLSLLGALLVGQLHAQTGTIDDPIPSDRSIEASGGQARNVKYWYLLPSYDQIRKGVAYFTFSFATYPAPDSFDIYYGGLHVYSTDGLVTATRTVNLSVVLKKATLLKVIVNKDGNPGPDTEWVYSVESRAVKLTDASTNTEIGEAGTGYITGASPPAMPELVAVVKNPDPGSKVRWKLKVKYGQTIIKIPANGKFTAPTDASMPWNIYQQYLDKHGNNLPLFGGNATLTFQIDSRRIDTLDFRIGGQNPDPATVRSFIDSLTSTSAIAYPVGKAETFGFCGQGSFYNQFYDANSVLKKGIPQQKIGFPIRTTSKGFGMYQLSKIPLPSKVTIAQKWNWQENVTEGVRRLTTSSPTLVESPKTATALDLANALIADLYRTYPGAEPMPDVTYAVGTANPSISALDATTLSTYDGLTGCPLVKLLKISGHTVMQPSCWTYDETQPSGSRWTFHLNKNNFARKVIEQIE
jgi:hypothetical protein